MLFLLLAVRAYPQNWLTHEGTDGYGSGEDGSCGLLISEAGQTGMGTHGYTYISENDDTLVLTGGVATFDTPSGNYWFATATSGVFGGAGSSATAPSESVECGQFRYGDYANTTVTWTAPVNFSGTASLQVGYAAGYATVNYYHLTVELSPATPPPPPSPPSLPSLPLAPPTPPSAPPAPSVPPSAPKTCTASIRTGYDCMVEPPGGAQGYALHTMLYRHAL